MSWVTTKEATVMARVSMHTIWRYAKKHNWPCMYQGRAKLWRVEDVETVTLSRAPAYSSTGCGGMHQYARELVVWADALTEWPSDDEIRARVRGSYQIKDIESVIESRRYRKRKPLRKPV